MFSAVLQFLFQERFSQFTFFPGNEFLQRDGDSNYLSFGVWHIYSAGEQHHYRRDFLTFSRIRTLQKLICLHSLSTRCWTGCGVETGTTCRSFLCFFAFHSFCRQLFSSAGFRFKLWKLCRIISTLRFHVSTKSHKSSRLTCKMLNFWNYCRFVY